MRSVRDDTLTTCEDGPSFAQQLLELYFCLDIGCRRFGAAPMTTAHSSLRRKLAGAVSVDPTPNTGAVAGTSSVVHRANVLPRTRAGSLLSPRLLAFMRSNSLRNSNHHHHLIDCPNIRRSTGLTIILILKAATAVPTEPPQEHGSDCLTIYRLKLHRLYITENCALTQKLPADFLRSMPQGAGCHYGNALKGGGRSGSAVGGMGDLVRQ